MRTDDDHRENSKIYEMEERRICDTPGRESDTYDS